MAGIGTTLGKKVGPFSLGVWLGIAVGGIALGLMLRKGAIGLDKDASADEAVTDDGAGPVLPLFQTQGAKYAVPLNGGTGAPYGGDEGEPKTNPEWVRYAVSFLIGLGQGGADTDSALRKYIEGRPVTSQEKAIIDLAIVRVGVPPEPVPPIELIPDPVPEAPGVSPAPQPTPPPPTAAPVLDDAGVRWVSTVNHIVGKFNRNETVDRGELDTLYGSGTRPDYAGFTPEGRQRYAFALALTGRG